MYVRLDMPVSFWRDGGPDNNFVVHPVYTSTYLGGHLSEHADWSLPSAIVYLVFSFCDEGARG